MKAPIIFLDNHLVSANSKLLTKLAPWNLPGRGVFETMLVEEGKIVFLPQHLRRLLNGLKVLKIKNPCSARAWERHLYLLIYLNYCQRARLRLTVWRHKGQTRFCVSVTALEMARPVFRGVIHRKALKVVPPPQRIKSIDYKFFANAYKSAQRGGYDEAVILNDRGEVVEASRSNVFIVKEDIFLTPSLASGALEGITRQVVLLLARQKRFKVKEVKLYREDLETADEIFVTNSLRGIIPVTTLGQRKVAGGRVGPGTKCLQAAYKKFIRSSLPGP